MIDAAKIHMNLDSIWSFCILCNIFRSPTDTCSQYSDLLWAGTVRVNTLVKAILSAPI